MGKDERSYYRKTLAWARLDVDMESGECLIEEIQTDWVREAKEESMRLNRCRHCKKAGRFPKCKGYREALTYLDETLVPYATIWDQAMLSATLYFLIEELGVRDIWYHDWETGNALKGLYGRWLPPRSLYSNFPRRFCFRREQTIPGILRSRRTTRRLHRSKLQPYFYRLPLHKENQHA